MPRMQAANIARGMVRVTRRAVAAGPIRSAVERIDPMAREDRPTETARASMNSSPTLRRPMPRAEASSGLTELRSSGRWIVATRPRVATLRTTTIGTVDAIDGEDRSEQDLLGGAGRGALGGVEIEEQCGQPGRRARARCRWRDPGSAPAGRR